MGQVKQFAPQLDSPLLQGSAQHQICPSSLVRRAKSGQDLLRNPCQSQVLAQEQAAETGRGQTPSLCQLKGFISESTVIRSGRGPGHIHQSGQFSEALTIGMLRQLNQQVVGLGSQHRGIPQFQLLSLVPNLFHGNSIDIVVRGQAGVTRCQ